MGSEEDDIDLKACSKRLIRENRLLLKTLSDRTKSQFYEEESDSEYENVIEEDTKNDQSEWSKPLNDPEMIIKEISSPKKRHGKAQNDKKSNDQLEIEWENAGESEEISQPRSNNTSSFFDIDNTSMISDDNSSGFMPIDNPFSRGELKMNTEFNPDQFKLNTLKFDFLNEGSESLLALRSETQGLITRLNNEITTF